MRFIQLLALVLISPVLYAGGVLDDPMFKYENAHKAQQKTKQPLVVICGAEWCGPCKVYKAKAVTQLANLIKSGKKRMHLAVVDVDKRPDLKKKLFGETKFGVPFTVIYKPKKGGGYVKSYFYGEATLEFLLKNIESDS